MRPLTLLASALTSSCSTRLQASSYERSCSADEAMLQVPCGARPMVNCGACMETTVTCVEGRCALR